MSCGKQSRVSNGTGQCNFLGQWDGTGWDSQNLRRDGPGHPKPGTGRGTKRDRAQKDVLKKENDVLKQENDVLKQENDVQKQEIWSFF